MNEFDYRAALCEPWLVRIAEDMGIPFREMDFTPEIHRLFDEDAFGEIEIRFRKHLSIDRPIGQEEKKMNSIG